MRFISNFFGGAASAASERTASSSESVRAGSARFRRESAMARVVRASCVRPVVRRALVILLASALTLSSLPSLLSGKCYRRFLNLRLPPDAVFALHDVTVFFAVGLR